MTHTAQADMWANQFPPHNCRPDAPAPDGERGQQEQQQQQQQRFLLTWWEAPRQHGIGSHVHLMTEALALAVVHRRVLVVMPQSFDRADHEGCKGPHAKSFSCYFFPPTSRECEAKAMELWHRRGRDVVRLTGGRNTVQYKELMGILGGNASMVVISLDRYASFKQGGGRTIPSQWGKPWLQRSPKHVLGVDETPRDLPYLRKLVRINWWRSQASRFLLRWPSAYLCHLLNFARHQTYGMHVAAAVLAQTQQASDSVPGQPAQTLPSPSAFDPTHPTLAVDSSEFSDSTKLSDSTRTSDSNAAPTSLGSQDFRSLTPTTPVVAAAAAAAAAAAVASSEGSQGSVPGRSTLAQPLLRRQLSSSSEAPTSGPPLGSLVEPCLTCRDSWSNSAALGGDTGSNDGSSSDSSGWTVGDDDTSFVRTKSSSNSSSSSSSSGASSSSVAKGMGIPQGRTILFPPMSVDVNPAPFIPRPLVRLHVRGSDKHTEMRVLSLEQYVWVAGLLRQQLPPQLQNKTAYIWLSSEDQATFHAADKMKGAWGSIYSLHMERKWDYRRMRAHMHTQWSYTVKAGLRNVVEASFLNLLVSVEADVFVFALQSNWDRLANELRLTGGGLLAPVKSLNLGEA